MGAQAGRALPGHERRAGGRPSR